MTSSDSHSPSPRISTKIIATIGPASQSPESLRALALAGVDVFRLNFSHGTLEQHAQVFDRIRAVNRELGIHKAVMADLCGPKIRVDPVEDDSFAIAAGDTLDIVGGHVVGNRTRISTNRPEIVREVQEGHRILIDDGNVRLRVGRVLEDRLQCVCEVGGAISTRKGINLPDSTLQMSALTQKDREDLAWAVQHGVDYVAMSFVRTADDLQELRALLPQTPDAPRVVAKIETVQAIRHLTNIIDEADVVLVARGDLGVEMDLARVPLLQKQITRLCALAARPVIIATQMLQSMVESPTATRAEVSDVANAILDKADAIMLSAETSVGEFPIDAVNMMVRIAIETEGYVSLQLRSDQDEATDAVSRVATAVAHGASLLARQLDARLVAVWTQSGNTARLLSKTRMPAPIIGLSPNDFVCRRMALYYGVTPVCLKREERILAMLRDVDDALIEKRIARPGDLAIVIAGTHLNDVGATNALLIHLVSTADQGLPRFTG
ncbi:Pyruvate kinase [Phycisphaerae bacterium RAS2]|nr:Pyruvate kinase [Phycisphaerae bacterium RAS2]